ASRLRTRATTATRSSGRSPARSGWSGATGTPTTTCGSSRYRKRHWAFGIDTLSLRLMALGATVYTIDIDLADADRSVYESLALRVARHPSESDDYLIARVLAYCLEYTEGIEFSKGGLSDPDEPPIAVRDLTGAMTAWIDIGSPDATRLHRAAKLAPRVAVYMHKDPAQYLRSLSGARIHRGDSLELLALDRALITGLAGRLERRMAFAVSVADRELFVSIADATLTGAVRRCTVE